jgi:DNA-binding protein H-NS
MSRFRQDLMSRSRQALIISKKFESNNRNIDDEMIKHDHENEFTEIFLQKEKSEVAFRDKTQNTLLASSQQVASFEKNILNFLQKRKIIRRKTVYNRHVLEEKKNKNFQDKTFIFIHYRLLF